MESQESQAGRTAARRSLGRGDGLGRASGRGLGHELYLWQGKQASQAAYFLVVSRASLRFIYLGRGLSFWPGDDDGPDHT